MGDFQKVQNELQGFLLFGAESGRKEGPEGASEDGNVRFLLMQGESQILA